MALWPTEAESTVSRVHVIEDDGESAKISGPESVGTVEEEDQHQDPDGISNPPFTK